MQFGGAAPNNNYKYEGRRVGMDFFQSPRGPPGDLKQPHDLVPGRQGLAGQYEGNREKENPWEWNCVWEEMGIPGETKVGLAMEAAADKARGAPQRRVVQDRGVYPAAQGEQMKAEAVRLQQEFAIERAKLLAARLQQALHFDDMRDDVIQGRIKWERNKGAWAIKGQIRDDNLILYARKGIEFLNETPFDFDRPEGNYRPRRQHEMLSQLARAPTIRDVDKIARPNPPYAWVENEETAGKARRAPHAQSAVHAPHADRYPARTEWDVRSLMRGERRSVAMQRAQVKGNVPMKPLHQSIVGRHAQGREFALEGGLERAEDVEEEKEEARGGKGEAVMRLVEGESAEGGAALKVLYPGGKRWSNDSWVQVPPAIVTVCRGLGCRV